MGKVFHLKIEESDLRGAKIAILPGDPGRVPKIAAQLDEPVEIANNREYRIFIGQLDGNTICVCSTGIGGPSTSIAVEELGQLGINTFLRVGTTGALQPEINVGDVIVSTAAVRLDGASQHFAPLSYPAVAHHDCTNALIEAAKQAELVYRVGITASSDTFYPGQERYETASGYVIRSLQGSAKEWQALNVLNYEMESATLFTMCSVNRWRAGMVAGVLANRHDQEIPDPFTHDQVVQNAITVVVEAARKLTSTTAL